ncbi:dolichol-phosphate mannosyltransferase 2 [Absidia repens]|uniref:Dolichol phosphate-mannose biosynthesis regulatory protein n=1 Tax=Absidia repens TaxID=90262 RepID=A0A1X2IMB2_9FUNG|nr:dolichol-phosphate mannosyltransferase 2 [Absidia repens]
MGTGIDKLIGTVGFFVSSSLFIYYTVWVLLMPFVDDGHFLHNYFPNSRHAIRIPLVIMILTLTIIFTFLGTVMVKSKHSRK